MGTYRNISLTFWSDAKINNDFSAWDKYVYLYLLTNPKTSICGCYEISQKQMILDTGLPEITVKDTLHRLQNVHHVIAFCEETREVLIYKWGRYNWSRSDKVATAVRAVAEHIKCPEFKAFILDAVETRIRPGAEKEERTKEENSKQKSDTVSVTDVSIGYGYPIDTLSEAEKKEEAKTAGEDDFERLWKAYPAKRRYGKETCREAFEAAKVPVDSLLAVLEQQKASENWTKDGGKYIPGLIKWITEARWEDWQPAEPQKDAQAGGYTMSQSELEAVRAMASRKKKSH